MTTYKLKSVDKLYTSKRETAKKIQWVLREGHKTTKEIWREGKSIFGNEWPRDQNTIRRYLNTMLEAGMVRKNRRKWELVSPIIPIEQMAQEFDVQEIERQTHNFLVEKSKSIFSREIVIDGEVAIYGLASIAKHERQFADVIEGLQRQYKKLDDIIHEAFKKRFEKVWLNDVLGESRSTIDQAVAAFVLEKGMAAPNNEAPPFSFKKEGRFFRLVLDPDRIFEIADFIESHFNMQKEDIISSLRNYKMNIKMCTYLYKLLINLLVYKAWRISNFPVVVINPNREKRYRSFSTQFPIKKD